MPRVLLALTLVAGGYPALTLLLGGQGAFRGAAIVGAVTVGASLLAGVPLTVLFVRRRLFKLWHSALVGLLIGMGVGEVFNTHVELGPLLLQDLKFAAVGCLHTTVFWFLAFWKNQALLNTDVHATHQTRQAEG